MPAASASVKHNLRVKHNNAVSRQGAGRNSSVTKKAEPGQALRPTSLKLPAVLKIQIDEAANREGISAHAFMLQTLSAAAKRAQQREKFQQDSIEALHEMQSTGMGYELGAVREYFSKLAAFRKRLGPKPRRPALTKIV